MELMLVMLAPTPRHWHDEADAHDAGLGCFVIEGSTEMTLLRHRWHDGADARDAGWVCCGIESSVEVILMKLVLLPS